MNQSWMYKWYSGMGGWGNGTEEPRHVYAWCEGMGKQICEWWERVWEYVCVVGCKHDINKCGYMVPKREMCVRML